MEHNKHDILSEVLLMPGANMVEPGRASMFGNHITQIVPLLEPERPMVYSGFENQIGEHSLAYKKADGNYEIVSIIEKNKYNKLVVLKNIETDVYDIIKISKYNHVTENYGYIINDIFSDKKEGDVLKKDDILYRSNSYDNDMNLRYGSNLRVILASVDNMTYEDPIIVSESAATKKLVTMDITTTKISVNDNDILMNIYGDFKNKTYKTFPDVGENVNSRVLAARRRINSNTVLFNLKDEMLTGIDSIITDDDVFYSGVNDDTVVVDIDIFSNKNVEDLSKYEYNGQIVKYLKNNTRYYNAIKMVLGNIVNKPLSEYSSELEYEYYNAISIIDTNIKWRDENVFDNMIIKITTASRNTLNVGGKICGRYANKGVTATVRKDSDMPKTKEGYIIDAIISPQSAINRTNPMMMMELEITMIAQRIVEFMANKISTDFQAVKKVYFKFLELVNENDFKLVKEYYDKIPSSKKRDFFLEIIRDGIEIRQAPFFNNITKDVLFKIYDVLGNMMKLEKDVYGKWIIPKYEIVGMEEKYVMGYMYIFRLKHYGFSKYSVRATGGVNVYNIPDKNKLFKNKGAMFSNISVRSGEMEFHNLRLTKDNDELNRFVNTYSSNGTIRKQSIIDIINNGFMDKLPYTKSKSTMIKVLEQYLLTIGLEIVDD